MDWKAVSQWGITGIGIRKEDIHNYNTAKNQQDLYSLLIHPESKPSYCSVIGSIVSQLHSDYDQEQIHKVLCDPVTKIVSLTITEGSYFIDHNEPDCAYDLQMLSDYSRGDNHEWIPRTAFGWILKSLDNRKKNGISPFTVMSCDNIQSNGHVTKKCLVDMANAANYPELREWIDSRVRFPNSMVDRITPRITATDQKELQEHFHIADASPVVCEEFCQWFLEDNFDNERPKWEDVGVKFVPDVIPYELMKLRLLNSSHQALAYIAAALNIEYVNDAMDDVRVRKFVCDI